jgi:5'-phosphate synthase pdxT subunit
MRVGVLALQGAYAAHARTLARLGHDVVEVREAAELDPATLEGLALPGGESTTHLKIIDRQGLREALTAYVRSGRPVLATCAGLILAARRVTGPEQESFGWLDVEVARNAWGRQVHSFEAATDAPFDAQGRLPLIFIRAPRVRVVGPEAEVVATYEGEPVLVRQGNLWGATFHPELTDDTRLHARVFSA